MMLLAVLAASVALCVLAFRWCQGEPEPQPILPPIPTSNQPP
jgi:hypothetical protein